MEPIHRQVLEVATGLAGTDGLFGVADVIRRLPHLNPATVRTHVASRCCVNAPVNHQSRYPYFRAVGRGVYRLEPPFRRSRRQATVRPSQDLILERIDSGFDPTLIARSFAMSPTDRLEMMRAASQSLEPLRRR